LTNGGDGLTNGGVLPMNGDHHETEKKEVEGGEGKCSKQNGSALDYLQKTVNDIEEYGNDVETDSIPSASSSKKQKLSEQDEDKDTHGDENTIPLKTPRGEISEDQQNGDVLTNGNVESEKVNGKKCDSETGSHNQTTDTKQLNDISQQNGHVEATSTTTNNTRPVSDGKTTKTTEASHEKTSEENVENGSTIDESMVNEKESKCEVSTLDEKPTTLELSHPVNHKDHGQVPMEVDDQAKSVVEPTTVNPKDLSLAVTKTQQQSQQNNTTSQQNISSTTEQHQLSNTTTPSDCSSDLSSTPSAITTPRPAMDLRPKVAAPQLNIQGETSYWQLNGKHKRKEVFACRWDRCNSQPFSTSRDLMDHMVDAHAPPAEGKMSRCKVKGCSTSHKPRGVLICHFRDNHCQCISPDEIEKSKDFRMEDESPVTRSIRYTSTLILRNLIRSATRGEDVLSSYESHLASVAMSASEATLAAVDGLFELNLLFHKTITSDDDDDEEEEDEELMEDGGSSTEEKTQANNTLSQSTTCPIAVS